MTTVSVSASHTSVGRDMRPLRVLFLNDAVFEDVAGGGRLVARELARVLAARGHEVTFLVPRHREGTPDDESAGERLRVVRYSGAGGRASAFLRAGEAACARLLASNRVPFDIVHTHFAYAAAGPLRAIAQRQGRLPHVRTFYGPWDAEGFVEDADRARRASPGLKRPLLSAVAHLKRAARRRVERTNVAASDRVLVLSEHSRREALEYGSPEGAIRFAPGGADLARFHPGAGQDAARRTLGLPGERPILFTVRRLVPRMGLENLVAAMTEVVKEFPEVLLLIGGKGPQKEALESAVRERGLTEQVRLLGFIADEHLPDYYRAADLFVLPTVALEGFGLITVEAMASGTPVVGTPVGATPEILAGLEPRLVARSADPEALAEAIRGYLTARREGAAWAAELTPEHLRAYVTERYTWERHADAAEAAYREAIALRRGEAG